MCVTIKGVKMLMKVLVIVSDFVSMLGALVQFVFGLNMFVF
jgi:hypothetical protein